MPNNSRHPYLLRSLIRCGVCGLTFCGTWARNKPRYRCNGSMVERGPFTGRCIGASIKGDFLEDTVWSDVSRFSRIQAPSLTNSSQSPTMRRRTPRPRLNAGTLIAARDAARDRRFRALDI